MEKRGRICLRSVTVCLSCVLYAVACTSHRPATPSTRVAGASARIQFAFQRTIDVTASDGRSRTVANVMAIQGRILVSAADSVVMQVQRLTDRSSERAVEDGLVTTVHVEPGVVIKVASPIDAKGVVVKSVTVVAVACLALLTFMISALPGG